MKNIEYYKDRIKENIRNCDSLACAIQAGISCNECTKRLFNWLLEEHKEPIKLKQWEYDFLFYLCSIGSNNRTFKNYDVIEYFYVKGYFKGIVDTSMQLQKILDNCEIVTDDYEWGE